MDVAMSRTWGPAGATRSAAWRLDLTDGKFHLSTDSGEEDFVDQAVSRLSVRGWWFPRLVVQGTPPRRLRGVRREDAGTIRSAIRIHCARAEARTALQRACSFHTHFNAVVSRHLAEQKWIPFNVVDSAMRLRPTAAEIERLQVADRQGVLTQDERDVIAQLERDPLELVQSVNEQILRAEFESRTAFFAGVERRPLTEEQARAVATMDNRVRVIAAAGSGKTSVMVARAAYAVSRGFADPNRILMLAFNKDAATELRTRTRARFDAVGLPSDGLEVTTFHAFRLSLIGRATGRKPTVAPWAESGRAEKISRIVDQLRDESAAFRYKWDLYRLLYSRAPETPLVGEADTYDRDSKQTGFKTFGGDLVRSEGERMIADWLYVNGVEYEYEKPYVYDVATAEHPQYRPDFFYPQVNVWHEHWATRADGTPPPSFEGYADGMKWKRDTHRRFGTPLIETTWHDIVNLNGLQHLADQLKGHGVTLDWNPDRPLPSEEAITHERLAKLMGTFLTHVKAGSLTHSDLAASLAQHPSTRDELFVELFWQVFDAWQRELAANNMVDFDDMILQAAQVLEGDPSLCEFDLVLVDEFQDTSRSRAHLVQALCTRPETYLLTVGDDWQAINRFAGADLSVMTDFDAFFGPSTTLRLQTTFRNTQRIADVARRFISRNPAQLTKEVRAHTQAPNAAPVVIVRVDSPQLLAGAVEKRVSKLAAEDPGATIDVLGRYRDDTKFMPRVPPNDSTVSFRTVHSSKGLEADHVVLPNLTKGTRGFPSAIEDDRVLALAIPADDGFTHSEERRLFYVALTRARKTVTIFTVAGQESPFIIELLTDPDVVVQDVAGGESDIRVCPDCQQGTLQLRSGPYGPFYGCSRFPRCRHTSKVESRASSPASNRVSTSSKKSERR